VNFIIVSLTGSPPFAGNLELNITEDELRKIFGRYGKLSDVDVKRPPPGTGDEFPAS
jgi:RNA-binding protein 15